MPDVFQKPFSFRHPPFFCRYLRFLWKFLFHLAMARCLLFFGFSCPPPPIMSLLKSPSLLSVHMPFCSFFNSLSIFRSRFSVTGWFSFPGSFSSVPHAGRRRWLSPPGVMSYVLDPSFGVSFFLSLYHRKAGPLVRRLSFP